MMRPSAKMKRLGDRLESISRGAVVTAVVLSPWLFGSADPWAYLLISMLVSAGVGAWLLSLLCRPRAGLRAPRLTLLLLLLLGFVLLQTVPLPAGLVKVVSPLSAEAQLRRIQLFEETGAGEFLPTGLKDNPDWLTISASAATRRSLYLFAAYLGVFFVMANAFTEWAQVRKAATALVISSFAMAILGTIHKFSGSNAIFWFHKPRFGGAIFGPFTNPNHYAAYMNMAFGVALGLLLSASRTPGLRSLRTWREKLASLSTARASRITLLGFATALMGASVCVSLSRGGIACLAAALGIVGVFVALRAGVPNRGRVVAAVALLVVAAVVWLGWRPVVRELGTLADIDLAGDSRTEATRATLRLFATSPLFGVGFGSFQHVFPKFQTPRIQIGRWLCPHNDYAQFLAEGGIAGVLLASLAGGLFVRTVQRRFAKAINRARLFVGGLAVGLVAIALHSFVDYGLHKPANAFLLTALCGMSIAAVHLRNERKKKKVRRRRNYEFESVSEKREALVAAGVS